MFRLHPSFLDLFMILMSIFLVLYILGIKFQSPKPHYIKVRESSYKKSDGNKNMSVGENVYSLKVSKISDGKMEFTLMSEKTGTQKYNNIEQVLTVIKKLMPASLYLDINESIPTKVTQILIYQAYKLNIIPYLTVTKD